MMHLSGVLLSWNCEHLFSLIKDGNSNPDPMQTREGASRVTSANAVLDAGMFTCKKRANTCGAGVDATAYLRPLPKRRRKQQELDE